MGCLRRPQLTPILIKAPDRIKIASIASGYAHTMLLTTTGQLYGCGYNDRGQVLTYCINLPSNVPVVQHSLATDLQCIHTFFYIL